jgi:phospholipid-binding lipoprotein MlaA
MRTGIAAAALTLWWSLTGLAGAQTPAPAEPVAPPTVAADDQLVMSNGSGGNPSPIPDPWEGWNRKVFAFNNSVDRFFAEPFARTYQRFTPTTFRSGVRNWTANLAGPVIFLNDVMQAQPKRAGVTALRFGINSTVGILGLFDAARVVGLEKHTEDFGQTLGRYGAKPGPYVMLPILGPSSVRDAIGSVADLGLDPFTYARFNGDTEFRVARVGASLVTARTDSLETVANLRRTSTDPYVTLRTLYGLARDSEIRNGLQNVQDLPDFGDPMIDEGGPMENTPK